MTNLQAALGLAQLEQLEDFILIKKDNYEYYRNEVNNIKGLKILEFKENIRPNYWFYSLFVDDQYKLNRDQIIQFLATKNVQSRPIWALISDQKPYAQNQTYKVIKARMYLEHIVNLPCSSNLSREDAAYVIECLKHPEM